MEGKKKKAGDAVTLRWVKSFRLPAQQPRYLFAVTVCLSASLPVRPRLARPPMGCGAGRGVAGVLVSLQCLADFYLGLLSTERTSPRPKTSLERKSLQHHKSAAHITTTHTQCIIQPCYFAMSQTASRYNPKSCTPQLQPVGGGQPGPFLSALFCGPKHAICPPL